MKKPKKKNLALSIYGRLGGKKKSAAKTAAAKTNGVKGGRPRNPAK